MKKQSGIILIVSLWILSTLSLLSLGMAYRARVELKLTNYYLSNMKEQLRMEGLVYRIIDTLISDETLLYDTQEEFDAISDEFSTQDLDVRLYDEDSKININTAADEHLALLDIPDNVRQDIILCRPYGVIDELFLIEGVDALLYNGDETLDRVGLKDLFSVWSSGKMNVNTASSQILHMIPGITDSIVNALCSYREYKPFESDDEIRETLLDASLGKEAGDFSKYLKTTTDIIRLELRSKNTNLDKELNVVFQIGEEVKIPEWRVD